jgi:1,4-dihydroxy-6-naphthoate synthase
MRTVSDLIRKSVEFSREHYPELSGFVRDHAQEMSEEVMRQHINLYVNEYTVSLGPQGRQAVWQLLESSSQILPQPVTGSFEVFT